jgi:hypothetical protein
MKFNEIEDIFYKNQLLDKYNIERIGIFGSVARGENGNDVDIFIEKPYKIDDIIKLRDELEKLTLNNVDIMLEDYANPIVLYRAKKELKYVKRH